MCVLHESSASGLSAGFLTDQVLALHPGTLARLDTGANLLLAPCGQGGPLFDLARRFPRSRFAGIDDSEWAVTWARLQAGTAGLANLWFESAARPPAWFDGIFHFALAVGEPDDPAEADAMLARLNTLVAATGTLVWIADRAAIHRRLRNSGWRTIRHLQLPRDYWPHVFIARR